MSEVATINNLSIARTPFMIATEINSIKEQTRKMVLFNTIEIGRRLVEAKAMIPHGEWGNWLKESVNYSQSTANNLMRIFKEYGANQIALFDNNAKSQALGNLSYTQAVALLGIPAEEREQFIEEHNVENLSSREIQKLIKERDKAIKEKEELQAKLESDLRTTDKVLRDTQATVKMLQDELEKERQRTKSEVERLTGLLNEARANGASDEMVKQLEDELKEARRQVQELTDKLNQPVTIETAVVEKIPEEVEQELNELRKKVAQSSNATTIKFKVQFDQLVDGFRDLLATLDEIRSSDPDLHEKYKGAVRGLISKMEERLTG